MRHHRAAPSRAAFWAAGLAAFLTAGAAAAQAVDYDIVYVRQPRYGDNVETIWPEVFHPARAEPGADLMLLHPDGSEEVLVDCGVCSVTDPYVSFDGETVFYSLFHDLTQRNSQRNDLPLLGADVYKLHLPTRQIERLTWGEFTPNTGAGIWDESNPLDPPDGFNRLGYGILNLGPCPLPGGKIAFTSNRNAFTPPKTFTAPTLQLFVMDEDGGNVEAIAPMTIGSALHPTVLRDGRIMFSTYESQGLRDERLWGIWSIYPDGRHWGPVVSSFRRPQAIHFMTQVTNEDLVVVDYYNLNNNGFGALYRFPVDPPPGEPAFHSAFQQDNPEILQTNRYGDLTPFWMPFTPRGLYSITPFTHGADEAAPEGSTGGRVGKFTHPSQAPGGDMVVVWTPGPANDLNRPTPLPYYDGGIYLFPGSDEIWDPAELIELKNDPAYNEAWPRAVVPYSDVFGVAEPAEIPWLPNDGTLHGELPVGTPYGLVGTSSFYHRESFPGVVGPANAFDDLDAFNTSHNAQSSNWSWQGADVGLYDDSEIWAVRVLAMEPNTHRSYGPHEGRQYESFANERLRILGEIPLRKFDGEGNPVLDPHGNPDTSFLAKIPADTPFTFQTLDDQGRALNMAQTWHQVRPGEVRTDCGGCHAHSQAPLPFEQTAAALPGYELWDLGETTPLVSSDGSGDPTIDLVPSPVVDVEFYRDVRPILERSCVSCHNSATAAGNLVLDDLALYDGLPGDYKRLADDRDADWGHPPVIANGSWRQTNASRYVRMFQSRRSLLTWKLFGERLDGWTNGDHPTETVPGDPATLPPGAHPNDADLDFVGDVMPPPDTAPPLSEDEKRLIARWIDLGGPINSGEESGHGDWGWFLDDQRPTLSVHRPRRGANLDPVSALRIGVADANSGVDLDSLSIQADFPVEGRPPGEELADLAVLESPGVYAIPLSQPLPPMSDAHLFAAVRDVQGNIARADRRFATTEASQCQTQADCDDGLFCNGVEVCTAGSCEAGPRPACDDGVACTVDSCDEAADSCESAPNDSLCDNGLFCDGTETCDPVADCQPGTAPACDDGVGCTVDSCDEAADSCESAPNDSLCDNGLFCDGSETCDPVADCQPGTAPACDDGVGCTVDSCDEAADSCESAPNDSLCDNELFCDGSETCDPVADCQPGTPPACDDGVGCTVDSCNEAADSCESAPNDSLCDNGLFCDGSETCDPVADCQPGTPPACDDGVGCTVDSCDEAADSCESAPNDSLCDNGLFCDGTETCDPVADCQPGAAPTCDDGVGCTVDSCDEAADSCESAPDDSLCDNGLFCDGMETCDPAADCQPGTEPCPEGQSCNETEDICEGAGVDPALWMSFRSNTAIPIIGTVADEDLVSYDAASGLWTRQFDGSDVGLGPLEIDGLAILPSGDLLLSFTAAGTVDGLSVDDSDIVRFTPTSLGSTTAGAFAMYFDGSDVALDSNGEDVDSIALAADGRLIVSTVANFSGNGATGKDEDLFLFTGTLGASTAGSFALYFDGSDVGLASSHSEDVDAASSTLTGDLLLSTVGNFVVKGAAGSDEDVAQFHGLFGPSTAGWYSLRHDLGDLGINPGEDIGSLHLVE